MKKFLKWFIFSFNIFFIILSISAGLFIVTNTKDISITTIKEIKNPLKSRIYDNSSILIETIGEEKEEYIKYEDLPQNLINALISIEDINYFQHNGIDYGRTIKALIKNMTSSYKQGGSTITQQLVKNVFLTSEQTYQRKIKEAYIATKLEELYTKEEILTFYFNNIYFEQSIPGVAYASKRYFGKKVKDLNLGECAILASVVKSSSYYNPFKYQDRVNTRKNIVLDKMLEYNFINNKQHDLYSNIHISSFMLDQGELYKEPTYHYQSYLDIVYLELKELGYDLYRDKIKVETYLDTSIQTFLDEIQNGNIIKFIDENQQIGGSLINNFDGTIVGVIGGRNYNGSHIFNRAYSMKRQPASTIKPIFEYLLACEYLGYNSITNLIDEPYVYPNSTKKVENADRLYNGNITLTEALGYSKNTVALKTLENVEAKIGNKKTINYLNNIGLMDEGPYTLAYGIGGMTYGVSPTQLAAAYSILNREGNYIKPTTIKRIYNLQTNEILYQHKKEKNQVVSKESAFQIQYALRQVVKNNYYNIGVINYNNNDIGAKTGTNAFDKNTITKLGYPTYADKDTWIAGFNDNYSLAIWSGFDYSYANEKNYFGKNDTRRQIPKMVFKEIMKFISNKKSTYQIPNSLELIEVVKGINRYYLPNSLIPNQYRVKGYFNKNEKGFTILPMPEFPNLNDIKVLSFDDEYLIMFNEDKVEKDLFDYTKIYGRKGYFIKYKIHDETNIYFTTNNIVELTSQEKILELEIIPGFENSINISSKNYLISL